MLRRQGTQVPRVVNTLDQARPTAVGHPQSLGPVATDHLFYGLAHEGYLTSGGKSSGPLCLKGLLDHGQFGGTDVSTQFRSCMSVRLPGRLDICLAVVLNQEGQGQGVGAKWRGTKICRRSVEEPANRTIDEIRRDDRHEILRPTGIHDYSSERRTYCRMPPWR